jgi:ketosteroid isomerase-like protein
MSHENVELVRRAIAAYNRRDFDALRALNHPEIELDYSASRGVEAGIYRGEDGVFRFYRGFFETFERSAIPLRCEEGMASTP